MKLLPEKLNDKSDNIHNIQQLGMGAHAIIPVLRKWIQEDLKFKARLSYIASPKLSWIHEILSEKNQQSGIMMHFYKK